MAKTAKVNAIDSMDSGGGNWLKEPGTYHMVVMDADVNPMKKGSNEMINGWKVTFQVLEGTVRDAAGKCTEIEKQTEIIFFDPKLTDKNEGLFAKQKQFKFLFATGLVSLADLGKDFEVDLEEARGRHVIATLEKTKDGKYLELAFADIWHVDDPKAANFPKDVKAIESLKKSIRRKPADFVEPKQNGNAAKPQPAAAPPVDLAMDEL